MSYGNLFRLALSETSQTLATRRFSYVFQEGKALDFVDVHKAVSGWLELSQRPPKQMADTFEYASRAADITEQTLKKDGLIIPMVSKEAREAGADDDLLAGLEHLSKELTGSREFYLKVLGYWEAAKLYVMSHLGMAEKLGEQTTKRYEQWMTSMKASLKDNWEGFLARLKPKTPSGAN